MADTDKTVTATKTSLRIVESLKRLDGTGVTDVAKELELPKSTVHNHLATLAEGGYVTRRDGEHRIGLRFLELGKHTRNAMKLYELAQPEIVSLADETGELSNAAVEEHGEGVYITPAEGATLSRTIRTLADASCSTVPPWERRSSLTCPKSGSTR